MNNRNACNEIAKLLDDPRLTGSNEKSKLKQKIDLLIQEIIPKLEKDYQGRCIFDLAYELKGPKQFRVGSIQPKTVWDRLDWNIKVQAIEAEKLDKNACQKLTNSNRETHVKGGCNHDVIKDESLWSIAKQHYGFGSLWPLIHADNRDWVSQDGNLILIGTTLKIPRLEVPSVYTNPPKPSNLRQPGMTLSKLITYDLAINPIQKKQQSPFFDTPYGRAQILTESTLSLESYTLKPHVYSRQVFNLTSKELEHQAGKLTSGFTFDSANFPKMKVGLKALEGKSFDLTLEYRQSAENHGIPSLAGKIDSKEIKYTIQGTEFKAKISLDIEIRIIPKLTGDLQFNWKGELKSEAEITEEQWWEGLKTALFVAGSIPVVFLGGALFGAGVRVSIYVARFAATSISRLIATANTLTATTHQGVSSATAVGLIVGIKKELNGIIIKDPK